MHSVALCPRLSYISISGSLLFSSSSVIWHWMRSSPCWFSCGLTALYIVFHCCHTGTEAACVILRQIKLSCFIRRLASDIFGSQIDAFSSLTWWRIQGLKHMHSFICSSKYFFLQAAFRHLFCKSMKADSA